MTLSQEKRVSNRSCRFTLSSSEIAANWCSMYVFKDETELAKMSWAVTTQKPNKEQSKRQGDRLSPSPKKNERNLFLQNNNNRNKTEWDIIRILNEATRAEYQQTTEITSFGECVTRNWVFHQRHHHHLLILRLILGPRPACDTAAAAASALSCC